MLTAVNWYWASHDRLITRQILEEVVRYSINYSSTLFWLHIDYPASLRVLEWISLLIFIHFYQRIVFFTYLTTLIFNESTLVDAKSIFCTLVAVSWLSIYFNNNRTTSRLLHFNCCLEFTLVVFDDRADCPSCFLMIFSFVLNNWVRILLCCRVPTIRDPFIKELVILFRLLFISLKKSLDIRVWFFVVRGFIIYLFLMKAFLYLIFVQHITDLLMDHIVIHFALL